MAAEIEKMDDEDHSVTIGGFSMENLYMQQDGMSPQMPAELVGKTIKELKAMGAVEVGQVSTSDAVKFAGNRSMQEVSISPEAEEQARQSLSQLDQEDFDDPDYFLDDLSKERAMAGMGADQKKLVQEEKMMRKQKLIDDISVGVIMKALDKGIELDDEVYREMLEQFPHYQVKLENR